MNTTLNLGINKQGKLAYVLQLSNNERWELFFRPIWGQLKTSHFYDGLDNTDKDIRKIDHFSFHEDGTIHLTIKDASGYRDKIYHRKLANTITTMPDNGYGVLLIYSVYNFSFVEKYLSKSTPLKFKDTKNVSLHVEYGDINQFSLVFFLLGRSLDAKRMLQSHFPNVFNPGNSIVIGDYMVDEKNPSNYLQLLVASTNKVIPKPPISVLDGSKKFKQFKRIENPMGFSLACSDEHIREMV